MAATRHSRLLTGLVLTTLALCAFFLSQGVTALVGAKVLGAEPTSVPRRPGAPTSTSQTRVSRDPSIILRRNIFNSRLGDLMQVPVAEDELIDVESILDGEQVLTSCNGEMRLIGTAVIPDDFERSMTMIVGSSGNNVLHQGSAELDESRIRGIYSDSVVLQTASGGLCELAMFDAGTPEKPPAPAKPKQKKKKPARPSANRNAGLTPEELEAGITMRSPTLVHIDRELFSKVLDNPEKLTGSATVTPKIERGRFMGLRIGVMRPHGAVHELGMLAGDIIENIDGKQLPSTGAVLKALTSLRTADGFTVAVQRRGQTLNIRYNIDSPKDP